MPGTSLDSTIQTDIQ